MALPTTISSVAPASDYQHFGGPYLSAGGHVYTVLLDSGDLSLIEAHKATDPTSSFTEVDGANRPDLTGTVASLDTFQVADVIHVLTQEITTGRVAYHTFNMATDAWVVKNEQVTATGRTAQGRPISLVVRSDGSVVCCYCADNETVTMTSYGRVSYAVRSTGGVWTSNQRLDSNSADVWRSPRAVLGGSDRTHFFFVNRDQLDGYQRTLTSDNVLQALPAAFDTTVGDIGGLFGKGTTYVSGGATKVRLMFRDSADSDVIEFDSADTPTVSVTSGFATMAPGNNNTSNVAQAVCVADGTTLYVVYTASADLDIKYITNADGAGYSAATNLYTGSVRALAVNIYARSGTYRLAYVRDDAGTLAYDELDLRAVPSTGSRVFPVIRPQFYTRRR